MDFNLDKSTDWTAVEKFCEDEEQKEKTKKHKTVLDEKPPVKFAVIDAETDPFDGKTFVKPFIWGYYDERGYIEFAGEYATENLIDWISQQKRHIFAHNGGRFDFHFLIESFEKKQSLTVINGRLAKGRIGKAIMQDSYCILPVPLAALEKDQFDYSILGKDKRGLPENKKKISEYLKDDCLYLYKYVKQFIDEYGMNLTLAGTAMKQWEQMGGRVPKSNQAYYNQFLPFYYGGRVQPFQNGIFKGQYKIYDIKSAYPKAMLEKHPIGCDYYETRRPSDHVMSNSLLTVKCKSKGALPQRTKAGLFFPVGNGVFNITGWEFIKAKETNTIENVKILNAYVFEDTISFKDYVNHFYEMKAQAEKDGDKAKRTFAKLFLNSLYGKFAANPANYEEFYIDDYMATPIPVKENEDDYSPGPVYGKMQLFGRPLQEKKFHFYNIVTAASITGYVRAYLWESICKCENVLYCDTDSIICENGDRLDIGKNLGQWEMEGQAESVAIAGKKLYACRLEGGKIKKACKGVNISADQIEDICRGKEITWKSEVESFSLKSPKRFLERKVRQTI